MNLRKAVGRSRRNLDAEVNIIPVMNIFVILIPFLLLTATFVRIAIIDLALPSLEKGTQLSEEELKNLTLLVVSIKPEGFEVKTSEKTYPIIPVRNGQYDYSALQRRLKEVKKKYPELEDVVISPASAIQYKIIIKVLDYCREAGFPNFSISG
jgi:biopolymer transport protein ExbD